MCNILACVSQAQQFFLEYSYVFPIYIYSIGAISIDMLNMRSASLSSDLIDLPQDCIKKPVKNLLCVVANILVSIFIVWSSIHSFIPQTIIEHNALHWDWEYKN